MTIEDVEKSLPNGLHDAEIHSLVIDYRRRSLTAELKVWMGNLGGPPETHEDYRAGQIKIDGLVFLVMEPPDVRYALRGSTKLTVDACDRRQNLDVELLKCLPEKSFFRSLYVREWNAFIHFAGTEAHLDWIDKTVAAEGANS